MFYKHLRIVHSRTVVKIVQRWWNSRITLQSLYSSFLFLFLLKWRHFKIWSLLLHGTVTPSIVAHVPLLDQYNGSSSFFVTSGSSYMEFLNFCWSHSFPCIKLCIMLRRLWDIFLKLICIPISFFANHHEKWVVKKAL